MTALTQIVCGDDVPITVTVTKGGVALPLTGLKKATFLLKWNVDDDDAEALVSKTLGAGITVTNELGGLMRIVVAAANTVNLKSGTVQAALKIMDAASETTTVYSASLPLVRPAVRAAA